MATNITLFASLPTYFWILLGIAVISSLSRIVLKVKLLHHCFQKYPKTVKFPIFKKGVELSKFNKVALYVFVIRHPMIFAWQIVLGKYKLDDYLKKITFYYRILAVGDIIYLILFFIVLGHMIKSIARP
jgi:hypothetical protein